MWGVWQAHSEVDVARYCGDVQADLESPASPWQTWKKYNVSSDLAQVSLPVDLSSESADTLRRALADADLSRAVIKMLSLMRADELAGKTLAEYTLRRQGRDLSVWRKSNDAIIVAKHVNLFGVQDTT